MAKYGGMREILYCINLYMATLGTSQFLLAKHRRYFHTLAVYILDFPISLSSKSCQLLKSQGSKYASLIPVFPQVLLIQTHPDPHKTQCVLKSKLILSVCCLYIYRCIYNFY